jgi:ribosome-binding factor A
MKSSYQRSDRVADIIRREVSDILFREVKDPRLSFITITSVDLGKDLRNAKIYYTSLKEAEELEEIKKSLKKAVGFVQRKLGKRVHLRYLPQLSFVYDSSLKYGSHMDSIFRKINEELSEKEE